MQINETTTSANDIIPEHPTYRVDFYGGRGKESDEAFTIMDARNILDVVEWIESRRNGRDVGLFIVIPRVPWSDSGDLDDPQLAQILGKSQDRHS